jgi:hypothetical protein
MSNLSIYPNQFDDSVAFLELVSSSLDVQKDSLTQRGRATFDVEPGSYLLRAHWSDGHRSQQVVNVGAGDVELGLAPPAGEAPGLLELGDPLLAARPYLQGPATWDIAGVPSPAYGGGGFDWEAAPGVEGGGFDGGPAPGAEGGGLDEGRAHWLEGHVADLRSRADRPAQSGFTLWQKQGDTWQDVGLHAHARPIDGGVEIDLDVGEGLHVFQASSGDGQTQYVSIPAERSIVALRLRRRKHRLYLRVDARTADRNVEALRGYILRGELDVAHGIAANVVAERFLMAKGAAPRVAALGAYFLLRVGDLDRLHNWPDNLSKRKEWLPDGPVIAAWQRLRSPDPDYEEAFESLLEAERRGVPVYTEGVRLLKDGLDLFASDDQRAWDVGAVRDRVEAYAQAILWNKSETTYFGSAPDQPRPYVSAEGLAWSVAAEHEGHD